jgi:hypothetical protein
MKGRLPLLVLLASALAFLASLFLPWREAHATSSSGSGVLSLVNLFSGGPLNGWVGGVGDVAVLLSVGLAIASCAALLRPHAAAKLPLGGLGVGLGYFTAAVAVQVHATSAFFFPASNRLQGQGWTGVDPARVHYHTSWAYGGYLGAACGAIAAVVGLAVRRRELLVRRPRAELVAGALCVGLLASFLLPWAWFPFIHRVGFPGIASPAATIAALGLVLGAGRLLWLGDGWWRFPAAVAIAILTGATATALSFSGHRAYGTWIGVACAVLLVAVESVGVRRLQLSAAPPAWAVLRAGAAILLLVALFLPWQDLRAVPGSLHSANGWEAYSGAVTGGLALLLLAAAVVPALNAYALEAAVAIALLVSAQGGFFAENGNSRVFRMGYGLFVGFGATALLLIATLVPFRPARVDRRRALVRALPISLSLACVAAVIVPWWFVVPQDWATRATAVRDWLSVPALFLALYLVRTWILAAKGAMLTGRTLTLVPLALLVLPALELIRLRMNGVIWGGVILIVLCLLLTVCGWIEESGGGLENVRVPDDIWRIDRLPETES